MYPCARRRVGEGENVGVLQRIEEIRAVEHAKLRIALSRADAVLKELDAARAEAVEAEPNRAIDMFGQPDPVPPSAPTPSVNLVPLLQAWEAFEDKVIERLNAWEERLWPFVSRWNRGEDVSREIRQLTNELNASAVRIDELLQAVRVQSSFVGESRATILVVLRAMDVARKAEEQLIPALLEGSREAADRTAETAVPRAQSATDITHSLRAARVRAAAETEEADESPSIVQQFFKWLVRK